MGVHEFSELPVVMDRYAKSLEGAFQAAARVVAETGLHFFTQGTPVDTNRALSNWRVSIGAPDRVYVQTFSPGATGGKGSGFVTADVMAVGKSQISRWKPSANPTLYVVNNAPYIMKLERGWSAKQPGAFIATGLQAMKLRVSSIRVLKQLR